MSLMVAFLYSARCNKFTKTFNCHPQKVIPQINFVNIPISDSFSLGSQNPKCVYIFSCKIFSCVNIYRETYS